MKKILISVLLVLLLILAYVVFVPGLNIGPIKINSVKAIKEASSNLDSDFDTANGLVNISYPDEVDKLQKAITNLKTSKQDYENKNLQNKEANAMETVQIKVYTIDYIWTILGNYKNDRGLASLTLDLKSTQTEDVYDLQFTLTGNYVSITDFIYDIEDDEELNFEIQNLKLSSDLNSTPIANEQTQNSTQNEDQSTEQTTAQQTSQQVSQVGDGKIIKATFTVENVGITLK